MAEVSIIIPCFNSENTLASTLQTVLSQTYTNWECIIVDDSSTDNTVAKAKTYLNIDNRFILISNKSKKGAQGARNTGVLNSSGKWIVFFDSDNLMEPEYLEYLLAEAENNNADVCCCYSKVIDYNTKKEVGTFTWKPFGQINRDLVLFNTYVDYNSSLVLKDKLIEIGLLDEDCPSFQEWDTHLRLSKIANYYTVEKYLVKYFRGRKGAISSDDKKSLRGKIYIYKKHSALFNKYKLRSIHFCFEILDLSLKRGVLFFLNTYKELNTNIDFLLYKYFYYKLKIYLRKLIIH